MVSTYGDGTVVVVVVGGGATLVAAALERCPWSMTANDIALGSDKNHDAQGTLSTCSLQRRLFGNAQVVR